MRQATQVSAAVAGPHLVGCIALTLASSAIAFLRLKTLVLIQKTKLLPPPAGKA